MTKKRKLNRDQQRALQAAEMAAFVAEYGRQAQKGVEPNDRYYDRDIARRLRSVDPVELDRVLRDDEE